MEVQTLTEYEKLSKISQLIGTHELTETERLIRIKQLMDTKTKQLEKIVEFKELTEEEKKMKDNEFHIIVKRYNDSYIQPEFNIKNQSETKNEDIVETPQDRLKAPVKYEYQSSIDSSKVKFFPMKGTNEYGQQILI